MPFMFFLLTHSSLAISQSINDISHWKSQSRNLPTKQAKSENIEALPYYHEVIEVYANEVPESILSNFQEVDINADGVLDLIYNGNIGGEGDNLLVWLKDKDQYVEVLSLSGQILSIWKVDEGIVGFSIIAHGCCGDENSVFEIYEPSLKDGKLSYALSLKYSLLGYTELPNSISESTRFKTINNNYTLRGSPEINDTFPEEAPSRPAGNILCKIKKGTQGVKLAEKSDDTGRVWWFAALEIDGMKDSYFHNGDNEGESSHVLGWLSSRYIEIINP